MLAIDIVLLGGAAIVIVAAAAWIGGRFGARGEAERRRKLGERNAEREKARLAEVCAVCGEPIDAEHDVWDSDRWWHKACYREAVR